MELQQDIQYLKGVGPNRAKALKRLDIENIEDLLYHLPRTYQDRSQLKKISQVISGEIESVLVKVIGKQEIKTRNRLTISKLAISDGLSLAYVVWFNQPYLLKNFQEGIAVLVSGKVERKLGEIQFQNAEIEIVAEQTEKPGEIVPIYPSTEKLSQKIWRSIIKNALNLAEPFLADFLPEEIKKKYRLLGRLEALQNIHFPHNMEIKELARKSLAFEELFLFQLGLALRRKGVEQEKKGISHQVQGELVDKLINSLPFKLTDAQTRVISEIKEDLQKEKPMTRLVQGDVGAGKTVVASIALAYAIQGGYQGALMAPTEILAEQHFHNLNKLFDPLKIKTALLTGSCSKKVKNQILEEIKNGDQDLVVGTHALIQEEVAFTNLGLAITDEQHRFGVLQRASLQKKGANPDILVMTATPIPRTLALTLYGDLDVSVIDQLPPGRQPITTYWVTPDSRRKVYNFARSQVEEGRQIYMVCPLVEESEKLLAQAATDLANKLQTKIFPDLRIGLLHGKMKNKDKDQIMERFRQGLLDILVSTTVIEVGVDVPNATVMIIENSERFGLAQLHQLRGRVGRGAFQSYCILIANPQSDEGRQRMRIMTQTTDGFKIAEEDLKLRGPGDFLGVRQHGFPNFRIANLLRDFRILEVARQEAFNLVSHDPALKNYPKLKSTLQTKFASLKIDLS